MDITLETPAIETAPKPETPTLRYPVLMQNVEAGYVVLFTSPMSGTVLTQNNYHSVGLSGDDWTSAERTDVWTPFTGTLPLRNITQP